MTGARAAAPAGGGADAGGEAQKLRTREVLRQVRKLEISTGLLADGLIAGNYRSTFKGMGMEFSELREYVSGDDVRSIDWKVTARLNHPYVKEFVQERDIRVYFVLDMSASGGFGSSVSKRGRALEIVAALMFAALRNNDSVGAVLVTDRVEGFVPARRGRRHILRALVSILSFEPRSRATDLAESLTRASRIIRRRGILFVVSDFFDGGDFLRPLKVMRGRHDIIALRVTDRREREIPDVGMIELEDEETGEQILVDTSDPSFRREYARAAGLDERGLEASMRRAGIGFISMLSDEPYEAPMRRFFRRKRGRR